jgi:hypothetical protein
LLWFIGFGACAFWLALMLTVTVTVLFGHGLTPDAMSGARAMFIVSSIIAALWGAVNLGMAVRK